MRIIHSLSAISKNVRGAVVALGNFDGLHLGHRAILQETLAQAKALSAPAAVMTFEPHPRRFFAPHLPHLRLMRLREKIEMLREMEFDALFIPRFDVRLASTSAEDFAQKILHEQLAVCHVVTGEDFCFGAKRGGNSALLKKQAFGYSAIAHIEQQGKSISSTAIREYLSQGDIAAANALLGYPYHICGHVTHGDKRGRTLGFPTANIPMGKVFLPRAGVYKVRCQVSGVRCQGVVNIGIRPTFGGTKPQAEIHLFDFSGDVYGQYLRVELVEFLRDEMKFSSPQALKEQILRDCETARA